MVPQLSMLGFMCIESRHKVKSTSQSLHELGCALLEVTFREHESMQVRGFLLRDHLVSFFLCSLASFHSFLPNFSTTNRCMGILFLSSFPRSLPFILLRGCPRSVHMFAFCAMSRAQGDILQHVLSRIATTAAEASSYIDLLALLVSKFTQQVTPFEVKLKEAFDYLTYLRPAVGLHLVEAVLPLLPLSKPFQDHMMIVLRKTMFRGDLQSRLTAVGGFGKWLNYADQHSNLDHVLLYDILGFINRALTQQLAVRSLVYHSLEQLVSSRSELDAHVIDMLSRQLERYYNVAEKRLSPVNLEACLDGETIVEPIGALVAACHRCASSVLQRSNKEKKASELLDAVQSMAGSLAKCGLADFELDKTADYGDSVVGNRNLALASLLDSLYIACMESWLTELPLNEQQTERVIRLYDQHAELLAAVNEGAKSRGAKKKDDAAAAGPDDKKRKTGGGSKKVALLLDQVLGVDAMTRLFHTLALAKDVPFQMIRDHKAFHAFVIHHLRQSVTLMLTPPGEGTAAADAAVIQVSGRETKQ